jgi:hypothetical protein
VTSTKKELDAKIANDAAVNQKHMRESLKELAGSL